MNSVRQPWNLGAIGRYGIDTPYEPPTLPVDFDSSPANIELESSDDMDFKSSGEMDLDPSPLSAVTMSGTNDPNVFGSSIAPVRYHHGGCNIVQDPVSPTVWQIRCLNIHLSRPELCSYLGFNNTKELKLWEDKKEGQNWLREWPYYTPPFNFGVAEILKVLCNPYGPPDALFKIEKLKKWSNTGDFPGRKARNSLRFATTDEEDIARILRVAAVCAWLIQDNRDCFPESKALGCLYAGVPEFWYAEEDINRAYWYLWNIVHNKWESKFDAVLPRETITFGQLGARHTHTPLIDNSFLTSLANYTPTETGPMVTRTRQTKERKWRALAALRLWARTVDPTVQYADLDTFLVHASTLITQTGCHGALAHDFTIVRMYIWKRGVLKDGGDTNLIPNLYEIAREIYLGLKWEIPNENTENLLAAAAKAVSVGDTEGFKKVEEQIRVLLLERDYELRYPANYVWKFWDIMRKAGLY